LNWSISINYSIDDELHPDCFYHNPDNPKTVESPLIPRNRSRHHPIDQIIDAQALVEYNQPSWFDQGKQTSEPETSGLFRQIRQGDGNPRARVRGAQRMARMEKVTLPAELREVTGKKVGALRRQGKLPGVVYGHNFKATPIIMDLREASKILASHAGSGIITLVLNGKEQPALVREKQRDYIRGNFTHIDFQAVSLSEKIRTKIGLTFNGVAPAVKDFNGVLVNALNEVNVESLAQDLPDEIVVDLSSLEKIGDSITVADLKVSDKVTILDHAEETVVIVTLAKEEEAPVEVAPVAEEPEVIEKGKKEEEEIEE
jgi:large subunit ribosomal protein L25